MADQSKSLWPKTPDGTTDWEVVFEDPDRGFIPLIIQAQSIASLRSGALVVIQQLFTRKADAPEIELLKARLDAVTSFGKTISPDEHDLAAARDDIAGLLRGVKDERKQKAAEYVANKRGAQSIERRVKKKKKKKGTLKKVLKIFAAPKVWIPALATVLVLIAGGSWLLFAGPSDEVEQEVAEVQSAAPDEAAPAEVEEKIPPIVALKPIRWQNPNAKGRKRERLFLPLLDLVDEDDREALCSWRASILDILNVTISSAFGSGLPLNPENLAQAGAEAARDVNARIGKTIVKKVTLLPDPNRRLLSGARRNCLLVTKEEYKKWGLAGEGE